MDKTHGTITGPVQTGEYTNGQNFFRIHFSSRLVDEIVRLRNIVLENKVETVEVFDNSIQVFDDENMTEPNTDPSGTVMRVSDTAVAFEWYENKQSDEQCRVYLTLKEIEDAIGALPKPEPVIIDDSRIRHVWVLEDDDECEDPDPESFMVPPTWYRENGTPVCAVCGQDLQYLHTILLPGKCETQPVPTKNRVVVQASGGVIQSVHADKDASVVILDHDDLMEEDGMTEELAAKIVREEVESLAQIY